MTKENYSCASLHHSIYFSPNELRHCCKRFYVKGKIKGDVKIIPVNKTSDISVESIRKAKQKLHNQINNGIENEFKVPIYGNRHILRSEVRKDGKGQYYLLRKAGIRTPKKVSKPKDIDRLCIVKVQQAKNILERAFFYVDSFDDFKLQSQDLLNKKIINKNGLEEARIEEYVLGSRFNANFQGYGLIDEFCDFDLVGFSDRRQVNLQGFLNLLL